MKLLIKIFISLAMLALAVRLVDLNELKHSLLSIPLPTLAMVVVIFFFGQLLSSYKWWLLARSGSIEAPWLLAAKAYFLGMAVNCFGFGTVGGDLARALVLGRKSKKKATALASVFADRVHGLTVLAAIGVVSIAFVGRQHIGREYLVLLPACITAVVVAWYFGPGIALAALPKGGALHKNMEQIAQVFPRDPATDQLYFADFAGISPAANRPAPSHGRRFRDSDPLGRVASYYSGDQYPELFTDQLEWSGGA